MMTLAIALVSFVAAYCSIGGEYITLAIIMSYFNVFIYDLLYLFLKRIIHIKLKTMYIAYCVFGSVLLSNAIIKIMPNIFMDDLGRDVELASLFIQIVSIVMVVKYSVSEKNMIKNCLFAVAIMELANVTGQLIIAGEGIAFGIGLVVFPLVGLFATYLSKIIQQQNNVRITQGSSEVKVRTE